MNIKDCVAVVTGAASGLGEATIRHLVNNGARAAIFDLQVQRGEALADELGDSVIFVNTDITSEESTRAAINTAVEKFGRINVAVNCAGIADAGKILSKKGSLSLGHFNKVIEVNLVGTVNIIRLTVEQMVKNNPNDRGEKGIIVNTASAAAFDGQIGQVAYSASKAGVVGMTLPIARECADYGVRVMTIAPGLFKTPMLAALPQEVQESLGKMVPFPPRLGEPDEFAQLVRHIIENTMLNGEVIRLDGAIRMAAR